jgi:hypothetical protein
MPQDDIVIEKAAVDFVPRNKKEEIVKDAREKFKNLKR